MKMRKFLIGLVVLFVLLVGASTSFARQITITWNANPENNIGYIIYNQLPDGSHVILKDVGGGLSYAYDETEDYLNMLWALSAYKTIGGVKIESDKSAPSGLPPSQPSIINITIVNSQGG